MVNNQQWPDSATLGLADAYYQFPHRTLFGPISWFCALVWARCRNSLHPCRFSARCFFGRVERWNSENVGNHWPSQTTSMKWGLWYSFRLHATEMTILNVGDSKWKRIIDDSANISISDTPLKRLHYCILQFGSHICRSSVMWAESGPEYWMWRIWLLINTCIVLTTSSGNNVIEGKRASLIGHISVVFCNGRVAMLDSASRLGRFLINDSLFGLNPQHVVRVIRMLAFLHLRSHLQVMIGGDSTLDGRHAESHHNNKDHVAHDDKSDSLSKKDQLRGMCWWRDLLVLTNPNVQHVDMRIPPQRTISKRGTDDFPHKSIIKDGAKSTTVAGAWRSSLVLFTRKLIHHIFLTWTSIVSGLVTILTAGYCKHLINQCWPAS